MENNQLSEKEKKRIKNEIEKYRKVAGSIDELLKKIRENEKETKPTKGDNTIDDTLSDDYYNR